MGIRFYRLISSFINLVVLLGFYYVLGFFLGFGDRRVKKIDNIFVFMKFDFSMEDS